ncbi:hypothetical protein IT895_01220 [Halomonas sp. A40-4]|uniref:hypothetical protein n=1 Tax=Halomonas sp. A40-4 TaxID=2785909 RepID=UPI0018F038C0|nr:hypothetical protein [Halomonas sp. A40-4]QPL46480.1 hypothetical protein IT895_01220 [Halomonas sp. A40-4]
MTCSAKLTDQPGQRKTCNCVAAPVGHTWFRLPTDQDGRHLNEYWRKLAPDGERRLIDLDSQLSRAELAERASREAGQQQGERLPQQMSSEQGLRSLRAALGGR